MPYIIHNTCCLSFLSRPEMSGTSEDDHENLAVSTLPALKAGLRLQRRSKADAGEAASRPERVTLVSRGSDKRFSIPGAPEVECAVGDAELGVLCTENLIRNSKGKVRPRAAPKRRVRAHSPSESGKTEALAVEAEQSHSKLERISKGANTAEDTDSDLSEQEFCEDPRARNAMSVSIPRSRSTQITNPRSATLRKDRINSLPMKDSRSLTLPARKHVPLSRLSHHEQSDTGLCHAPISTIDEAHPLHKLAASMRHGTLGRTLPLATTLRRKEEVKKPPPLPPRDLTKPRRISLGTAQVGRSSGNAAPLLQLKKYLVIYMFVALEFLIISTNARLNYRLTVFHSK